MDFFSKPFPLFSEIPRRVYFLYCAFFLSLHWSSFNTNDGTTQTCPAPSTTTSADSADSVSTLATPSPTCDLQPNEILRKVEGRGTGPSSVDPASLWSLESGNGDRRTRGHGLWGTSLKAFFAKYHVFADRGWLVAFRGLWLPEYLLGRRISDISGVPTVEETEWEIRQSVELHKTSYPCFWSLIFYVTPHQF
jgi:hypothetical protein